jgi:Rrf2 family protein
MYLSIHASEKEKLSMAEVAEELKIPKAFTGKILQELVKNQIISSVKGPNGGFYLTEENKQKPVIDIIHVVDGLDFFKKCGLGLSKCSDTKPCPFHEEFKKVREALNEMFTQSTISFLSKEIEQKKFRLADLV